MGRSKKPADEARQKNKDGWVRQLDSGLWAATVRTPQGRITQTFDLVTQAQNWASDQKSAMRNKNWIDPRGGELTVAELWEMFSADRNLQRASRNRDASHWRVHVEPYWGKTPIGTIDPNDVEKWLTKMERATPPVGGATREGSLNVLRGLLEQAVKAKPQLIGTNPARGQKKPRRAAHIDRVLVLAEDQALLDSMERHFPGVPAARLMTDLMLETGLRWEEVAALDKEHVNIDRRRIQVGQVMERNGTIRDYAKTLAGDRPVPIGKRMAKLLAAHIEDMKSKDLLFTAPEGGVLFYASWRTRVWLPALNGTPERKRRRGVRGTEAMPGAGLIDPQPTPHDLRHTYGTRLADAGVPPHDIMKLMGHENIESVQRYIHSGEGRFERARKAMDSAREPKVKKPKKTVPEQRTGEAAESLTHQ